MIQNFNARFRKLFVWSALLFVVLFVFRMIYGYSVPDTPRSQYMGEDFFGSLGEVRKNYASDKASFKMEAPAISAAPAASAPNQKFEKTAVIKSKSGDFGKDVKMVKSKTADFRAVIQYEQNTGLKGQRQIHLLIGVNPLYFDSFYNEIRNIGALQSIEVTKVDKTNEYKDLNAKKTSLEKTLQSLADLKSKGGQINDFVMLHDKILEIETRLQELGVELGNFDSENEFCTVRLSMYEGGAPRKIGLLHRVKVAFEWAITYYSILVFATLGMATVCYLLLKIYDKLRTNGTTAGRQ